MNVVAIIQARMSSTRLPDKVLRDITGTTMLARVIQRTRLARLVHHIVVATTVNTVDDPIVAECQRLQVTVFRGDEDDVLDRYYQAAVVHQAEAIVRITSDCPLIDAAIIDRVVAAFLAARPDYASNVLERTYPRGLDVEVCSFPALQRAWQEARQPFQRAHVTPYLYQHPHFFQLLSVTGDKDYSHYRWTVDTSEDLAFVRAVYTAFAAQASIGWQEVLALLEREPALSTINRHIEQKVLSQG